MKNEKFLKLKSQKRKAKLLAIFTILSLFSGVTKENKVYADDINNVANIISEEQENKIEVTNNNNQEIDTSGITDEIIAYAKRGHTDGPEAYETWYPLALSKVIENMKELYGYTDLEYKIRNDGVKILSGTATDGTKFKDLVIVAADVISEANPDGTFERGEFVETTLGKGIVADFCEEAMIKRKYHNSVQYDIATAWHTQPYESVIYGKKKQSKIPNEEMQINDKIILPPGIKFDPNRYVSATDVANHSKGK